VRIVAGLACLLLVAAPATVVASQAALDRATAAFQDADCATAIDSSLDSLDALRSRPEPYELLGYCNLRARQFELGLAAMQAASRRDPDNWEYFYGIAIAQALSGQDPRPAAATALALNPRDYRAREFSASLRRGGPRRWARAAAQARIPFQ
jgi:cytochrome c-type biogenesis protein CcmH/NrfG